MRIGPYADKTRFVFDAGGETFPQFAVKDEGRVVSIAWTENALAAPRQEIQPVTAGQTVRKIDFFKDGAWSKLVIELDGPAKTESLVTDGEKIQFALPGTTIPRSLRRVFDTLAFPSAIHSVTPYLVPVGDDTEVRFAVQLKGAVKTSLATEGNTVILSVADGVFAEREPLDGEVVLVPVDRTEETAPAEPVTVAANMTSDRREPQVQREQAVSTTAETSVSPEPQAETADSRGYEGEKISLVFDNANVKNILQLIAEVSNQNIIASDEVKGSVTLRLIDVPWDQALSLVLDITGLGMIQEGNVVRVMPKESIRAMKNAELTAATTAEKLEPLETEIVPVNYADLGSVSGPARDLISDRGKITEDQRNKALVITDVPLRIEKIRELVQLLDTPERQVMIEARIVEVNSNFSRDLGVNWGFSRENDRAGGGSDSTLNVGAGGSFLIGTPAAGSVSTTPGLGVGMSFGNLLVDNTILSMRISALEAAGNAKVISTPRVTTLNGEQALISQGTTIPYQSSGDDGLPKTEFVNAELKLEVTPVINPDGSVILKIVATNDSPSLTGGTANAPQIDTKKAETKVMVKDGQTTVIGGIFIENDAESESGVPLLKDIPILGHLFKSKSKANSKAELMIFITPRILQ
jgi:type IV pilus assembly protein PilQ